MAKTILSGKNSLISKLQRFLFWICLCLLSVNNALAQSIVEKGNYHTGTVVGATKDEHGFIKSVVTDDGRHFEADMFVDCTGFKSLLLEQELGVPFHSFHGLV